MKYYHIFLILFFLINGCQSDKLIKRNFNFNNLPSEYKIIDTTKNILIKNIKFTSNKNKISVVFFFDASCPYCWFKYMSVCDKLIKYTNNFDVNIFAYSCSDDFLNKKKYTQFEIKIPVILIDSIPNDLTTNILYFTYRNYAYQLNIKSLSTKNISNILNKIKIDNDNFKN